MTEETATPGQRRTAAATAASAAAARRRRIAKLTAALEAEGFIVRLEERQEGSL